MYPSIRRVGIGKTFARPRDCFCKAAFRLTSSSRWPRRSLIRPAHCSSDRSPFSRVSSQRRIFPSTVLTASSTAVSSADTYGAAFCAPLHQEGDISPDVLRAQDLGLNLLQDGVLKFV